MKRLTLVKTLAHFFQRWVRWSQKLRPGDLEHLVGPAICCPFFRRTRSIPQSRHKRHKLTETPCPPKKSRPGHSVIDVVSLIAVNSACSSVTPGSVKIL